MEKLIIAVIGMGYVGLPLAVAFAHKHKVIGYDLNAKRIDQLKQGIDVTKEIPSEHLKYSNIEFSSEEKCLASADIYIVSVPTPIDEAKKPDLTYLKSASHAVAKYLKKANIVVFESTVYPGATEEVCQPILEEVSKLKSTKDFKLGYSPERINPGDAEHSLQNVVKVVAAQDKATCDLLAELYGEIVPAGIHKASNIRVAEASKVIENTQRDLNIALVNELALIFGKLGIDTQEVLEAAGTKWNFLPFKPGLVGGHCIGVDPYYLTYKAEQVGHHPQVILAGRRINDSMGKHVAEMTVKQLIHSGKLVKNSRVGLLGLTFKENCPDLRNSQVRYIYKELKEFGVDIDLHDPVACHDEIHRHYGKAPKQWHDLSNLDAVVLSAPHSFYHDKTHEDYQDRLKPGGYLVDVKGALNAGIYRENGIKVWRL